MDRHYVVGREPLGREHIAWGPCSGDEAERKVDEFNAVATEGVTYWIEELVPSHELQELRDLTTA